MQPNEKDSCGKFGNGCVKCNVIGRISSILARVEQN